MNLVFTYTCVPDIIRYPKGLSLCRSLKNVLCKGAYRISSMHISKFVWPTEDGIGLVCSELLSAVVVIYRRDLVYAGIGYLRFPA
jgi:hypothetical protein